MLNATFRTEVEVELDLTGVYQRAEPDVGLGEGVEDIEIDSVTIITAKVTLVYKEELDAAGYREVDHVDRVETRHNLLDGVDPKSKDVQRLLANLLATLDEPTLIEALLENQDG